MHPVVCGAHGLWTLVTGPTASCKVSPPLPARCPCHFLWGVPPVMRVSSLSQAVAQLSELSAQLKDKNDRILFISSVTQFFMRRILSSTTKVGVHPEGVHIGWAPSLQEGLGPVDPLGPWQGDYMDRWRCSRPLGLLPESQVDLSTGLNTFLFHLAQ